MAAHHKKHRKNARMHYGKKPRHARKNNPYRHGQQHRRRHNPGFSIRGITGGLMTGLWALGGAVATRMGTQVVLGTKNTGFLGYAGNIIAVEGLTFGTRKFVGSAQANAVRVGGWVAIGLRVIQDFTPLGKFVQAQLAGAGIGGDTGLGMIVPQSFFSINYDDAGQILPSRFRQVAAPAASAGARGVGRSSYLRSSYAL